MAKPIEIVEIDDEVRPKRPTLSKHFNNFGNSVVID